MSTVCEDTGSLLKKQISYVTADGARNAIIFSVSPGVPVMKVLYYILLLADSCQCGTSIYFTVCNIVMF
jgi:hypothetical protein